MYVSVKKPLEFLNGQIDKNCLFVCSFNITISYKFFFMYVAVKLDLHNL